METELMISSTNDVKRLPVRFYTENILVSEVDIVSILF